ncbi:MAG TPA: translation initiation factor IF-2 [Polyangiaceae bacterium]|nr:translation initiation factor IF-2 [Polyangiaceae bacterium]
MTTKLRVYEVARDLGMEPKSLVALLQSVGAPDVRNHMSAIGPEMVDRVKRHLDKAKSPSTVEERIRPTVVKRRAAAGSSGARSEASSPVAASTPLTDVHKEEASSPSASRIPVTPAVEVKSRPAAAPAPVPVEPSPILISPPAPAPVVAPPPAPVVEAAPPLAPAPVPVKSEPRHAAPPPPPVAAAAPAVVVPPPAPAPPPVAAAPAAAPTPPPAAAAAAAPSPVPSAPPAGAPAARPSTAPKTGIDVWEGRPGVPMPQRGGPVPRRVQYDAKAGGNLGQRPGGPGGPRGPGGPGNFRGPQRPGMRGGRFVGPPRTKTPGNIVTQERSAHKKVVRIEESVGLQVLAGKIGVKSTEMLMKLMRMGMTGVNINSTLDADTAKIIANEFGWEVEDVAVSEADQITAAQDGETEEAGDKVLRPPVVTVMGHVDHGKTSLLDRIRKANVVSGEAGGITQHMGAYSVETPQGLITFLDTPGHEAFTAMRARGARTTDVVVLVVAADDGVMPQTREAIAHAKAANVPIVVAINKMDKPDANPERVRRQLSESGLVAEEWGGDTLYVEVSAQTGLGIDKLLETLALQAEVLELRANPNKAASGVVVEAELDRGRGPVATILVQDGTLNRGDVILAGGAHGKVRAMHDALGNQLESAGPSTPVVVIGLADVPSAGDPVHVLNDMKKAQEIADSRKTKVRKSLAPGTGARATTLEDLAKAMAENEQAELKLIIKADVQGSVEAVSDSLTRLSTEKVKVSVVHAAAGAITEGDVNLAVAAGAIIIGFNVRPAGKAAALAQKEEVQIRHYTIIYNVVDEVKAAMEGLLAPTMVEKNIGKAEIRQVFKTSKSGAVAGCMVIEGVIKRSGGARLLRDGASIWQGKIGGLKRFKDDAKEVKEGFECGISLDGYSEFKEGDVIEAFEVEEVKQTL